jgi:protease-4
MRLLRGFWSLLVGIKDLMVMILLLLFFGGLAAALSFAPRTPTSTSGAMVLKLDGVIVEQPAEPDPFGAIAATPITREYRLRDVIRAIDGAARDPLIKAVVLDLDRFGGGGQAALAAVGAALDRTRASGKPVLAYATGYLDDSYQLAAHASEIWLDPLGAVLIAGPGGSQLYYKGLLDKLGVDVEVYRVGSFKSAVEPFTRSDQSPEAREANQALADTLWATWRDEAARARPKARIADYVADPQAFITGTDGDVARAALAAGLIDRLGDRAAFERHLAGIAGEQASGPLPYQAVPFDRWIAARPASTAGDPVGVLTVAGEIVDGEAGPGTAAGDTIAGLLHEELKRGRIKALVVRVDSPGGSVIASERIRSAIMAAKAQGLPVVVSMGSLAASGGYWVATPADMIFAEPATITGSIGVFGLLPSFEGALAKLGLSADGVKTTPLSGEPNLFEGTSPEFDRLAQIGVEDMYRRFVALVAASRKLSPTRVDEIGQGRVWAGGTARQIGLVDRFGGLEDAVAEAARRAKLDPAKVHALPIEKPESMFARFFADLAYGEQVRVPADAWTRLARRPETLLARALDDLQRMAAGPTMQVHCLNCPVPVGGRQMRPGTLAALLARAGF